MVQPISETLKDPSKFLSEENHFGFYDWFCTSKSLERRAKALLNKFRKIAKSSKINLETSYLSFKNICPMVGNLFDIFRICDIESGEVLYAVTPKSGHVGGKAGVNGFKGETTQVDVALPTYKDIVAWFLAENKVLASIPDEEIPLHLSTTPLSIEGRRSLIARLKT